MDLPCTPPLPQLLADLRAGEEDLRALDGLAAEAFGPVQALAAAASTDGGLEPREAGETLRTRADGALAPGGVLLLAFGGEAGDAELAEWRGALWPTFHAIALYRSEDGRTRRDTQSSRERFDWAWPKAGAVLALRRRVWVMSPEATQEKFDANAAGWNGEPGGPGYPHFRWMRRFVALFAGEALEPGSPRAPKRILDFGCGAGWVGIEAAKRMPGAHLAFFDPSPEMVKIAEGNARAEGIESFEGRVGFGEDPPFPGSDEQPFDLVLSSGVVSFSPDFGAWYDGLVRAVAPGGTLVVGDIHRDSHGFRTRRATRPLLPVRELNARLRAEVRSELEARGHAFEAWCGYQLSWPIPQAMHVNETRLGGALTHPLLWLNRAAAGLDRALGSPFQDRFDSWVMRLRRPS